MLKGWTLSQDEEQVKEFTFAIAVQHRTGSSSQCSKEEKELNGVYIGKEEIKMCLFSDYMLFHKRITRNVLGWSNNSFRFFHLRSSEFAEKSEWTFWSTQYCKITPTTV